MSKKDKDKIKISFIGNNAIDVTGSMTLIEYNNTKILLECGLIQTNKLHEDFKVNSKPFKDFKPKDIKYVFGMHNHGDHLFGIPKLIAGGFRGEIFVTNETRELMQPMLLNSARIIAKDALSLKREPFYYECDVYDMIERTIGYDFNKVMWLDDEIGFQFLRNSHCTGAAQLELYIKRNNNIETILYTSDMGSITTENHYVDNMELCKKARVVITETTYGNKPSKGKNTRSKDIEKIKTVIDKTCIEDSGKVLIPVFAFSRSMEILTNLYEIYGQDESFKVQIVCDSPLLYDMMKVQGSLLTGNDKELFDKVVNWENVQFVREHSSHKALLGERVPTVILSASGMLVRGRSLEHLKSIITKQNCTVLFCGYAGENTIARKIMDGQKNIRIDGKNYRCNCNIVKLTSFSSHISHEGLLEYLPQIQCEKIALVHGNQVDKLLFKDVLEKELRSKDNTARVLAVQKGTVITL